MMKELVLDILAQSDCYVSGEEVSQKLGVSRAAVWKAVESLRKQGYQIEAVPRKGYRLSPDTDVLTKQIIDKTVRQLNLQHQLPVVHYHDTVVSTNETAKNLLQHTTHQPEGQLIVASMQTAGKGRRGRVWHSEKGDGLWFSLLLQTTLTPEIISRATLIAGLAVVKALTATWHLPVGLKWPNDLICEYNGKKTGGILSEVLLEDQSVRGLIIGIGININSTAFPPEIADVATSMQLIKPSVYKRSDILASILQQFFILYPMLDKIDQWLPEYKKHCLTLGQSVRAISFDGQVIEGIATDIDPAGELVIKTPSGHSHIVRSGEVSVRGMLGE